jgi:regulator of replication initiation timing
MPDGLASLDLERVADAEAREWLRRLLNLVEELAGDVRELRAENQRLRDENNRLRGEQGQPRLRAQTAQPAPTDVSSEAERRQARPRTKGKKRDTLRIDREETLTIDPAALPADAEFKGYEDVVVQDLVLRPDVIRFRKAVFYSPATRRTYRAALPAGYRGEFGPGVRTLALALAFGANVSEAKIRALLASVGVVLSAGHLSDLLIRDQAVFHAEKAAVYEAGLRSSPWQQSDDTLTRVNGRNHHAHVVGNPLYTVYLTTERKDRLTILDVLRNRAPRVYRVNEEALSYLATLGLPAAAGAALRQWPWEQDLTEDAVTDRLEATGPWLGPQQRTWVREATAVAAYQAQTDWPVVRALLVDDAPQFKGLTEDLALCWVHEGRHYRKLTPYLARHADLRRDFLTQFWAFYHELLAYQQAPTLAERRRLGHHFDDLFRTVTGYDALDARIAKTRARRASLLVVLAHPEIPLHNNAAELAARQRVRKRAVSGGPRTALGTQAWDTFQSLTDTTRKLGLSFYHYLQDRITAAGQIPALAQIIADRAQDLRLGASWGLT